MRDHQPLLIEDFNGFWSRGDSDPCPQDHFTECINVKFIESGVKTRDGLALFKSSNSVWRVYRYSDASVGDGYLVLTSDHIIYHVYGTIGAWTAFAVCAAIATMTDFAFISINGRAYISPSASTTLSGLTGEFIYVYDGGGANLMRKAAGTAPTAAEGAMTAAESATGGNVEAGIHVFGVVYETNSGFLTQIGPTVLPTATSTGAFKVDLASIPIFGGGGGTLITKRHIVASKLIIPATYSGDARGYQLYFVPGGTIANNTTTTLAVNFYDSELVSDASHLLDLRAEIPAVGGLGTYHNRMIGWDTFALPHIVMVSYAGEPEAFDAVDGLLTVPKEGAGIACCQEYRDILYVLKNAETIAFNDNGDVPTSWPSATVDQGLGAGKYGIATVGVYGGTGLETLILMNEQGIYLFNGTFDTPELSYKIKDYWRALTMADIRTGKVSAYCDVLNQLLYINISALSTILVGDYANGLNAEKIRWTKWTFLNTSPQAPPALPATIMLWDTDNKLVIGFPTGLHYISIGKTDDTFGSDTVKIPDPTVTTSLLPIKESSEIIHYGGAGVRVVGSGNLIPILYGYDSAVTSTLASIAMAASPGREPFVLANMLSQRARLLLKTTVINETFKINRIVVYLKAIYNNYPM